MNQEIENLEKKSLTEWLVELLAWWKIMISPLAISVVVAAIAYAYFPYQYAWYAVYGILFAGLMTGICWATYVWRKYGTSNFLSGNEMGPKKPENANESNLLDDQLIEDE